MMNDTPFFSVIIPTYNRAHKVGRSIQSVLDQSFINFELIIIDDGSTDNTKQVVEEFNDKRLRYIFQENRERGAARNHGISISKGNYVTFLDSDDLIKPNHLQSAFNNLTERNFPPFFHQTYIMQTEAGKVVNYNNVPKTVKGLITRGNFMGAAGIFLTREAALRHPFDEARILAGSEDYDLILTLITHFPFEIEHAATTIMINHAERSEVMIDPVKLISRSNYLIEKKLADPDFVSKFKKWIPAFISAKESFIALHLSLHGYKRGAWKYFLKSLRLNPRSLFWKRSWVIMKNILIKSPKS